MLKEEQRAAVQAPTGDLTAEGFTARPAVIHTEELTKRFGQQTAVDALTFEVPEGVIFGLIGPSGCGKTTTIRLLTGVYKPTKGRATVLGADPMRFSRKIRTRIGYMPQLFVLYPDLSVRQNLNFASSIYGMGLGRGKQLQEVLEFVELDEHQGKLVRDISGGMQRRLSLAATLVHDPDLLFLDEPTAGVDPVLRQKFWEHFQTIQKQGRTLVVTTQYVGEAAYCDLIMVMSEGRLLMVDTPEGLRRRAFNGDAVDLSTTAQLDNATLDEMRGLSFVRQIKRTGFTELRLIVDDAGTAMPALMEWLQGRQVEVESMQQYLPPFDDVFVKLVEQ